ncbi:MAG: hypothetical protein GY841_23635 [FCB group bacterium]|nr:hypothetical protein [FCB group bacterium]
MKKSYSLIMAIILALCLISAPVMAKKAGEIKDKVYTDKDYKFSMQIPEGWSTKIGKDNRPDRMALDEKSYPYPQHFQGGGKEDYAQIPMMIVLVDTCSIPVDKFLENLLDSKYKSGQKKYFMKKLRLISKTHEILKQKDITFHKAKAIQIEARQAYSIEVAERGSDRADVVSDFKGGAMFLTVRDGKIFVFHMIYEYTYNMQYQDTFNRLISSLKFE